MTYSKTDSKNNLYFFVCNEKRINARQGGEVKERITIGLTMPL